MIVISPYKNSFCFVGELDSPDVEAKSFANHSILHKADTSDQNNPTSRAPGYSPPHLEERTPRKTLTVVNADGELEEVNFWHIWLIFGRF